MIRPLEMRRATDAWQRVHDEVYPRGKQVRGLYGRRALDLAALILTDGLGQTLAYLLAKSKGQADDAHRLLFNHLSEWVLKRMPPAGTASPEHLLAALMAGDLTYYRRATVETLAYISWLKKFVEAEFTEEIKEAEALETTGGGS